MSSIHDVNAWLAQHYQGVLRYASRFCGNFHDAEDAVQAAMWKGVATGKLATAVNPVSWLRVTVRNVLIDSHRGRCRQAIGPLTFDIEDNSAQRTPAEDGTGMTAVTWRLKGPHKSSTRSSMCSLLSNVSSSSIAATTASTQTNVSRSRKA